MATLTAWKFNTSHGAEFSGSEAELIRTNLPDEQETKLREAFGLEE
jgi:uncharacterized membrane protein